MKHLEFYYIPPNKIQNNIVEFSDAEFKHLIVVARKKTGEIVNVLDGTGNVYTVLLTEILKKTAYGSVQKKSRLLREPNFKLTLVQAIPKSTRFELVIEKCTEIGISKIVPLITERSVQQGNDSKVNRWQKIAIAAMKQCTRSILPDITPPQNLDQILNNNEIYDFKIIAHNESISKCLTEIILSRKEELVRVTKIKSGIILIGPEGGFTKEEVDKAKSYNFQPFSLGQRRLRSETAGIVTTAIMMELIDNWI